MITALFSGLIFLIACGAHLPLAAAQSVVDAEILDKTSEVDSANDSKEEPQMGNQLAERNFRAIHFVQLAVTAILIFWGYSLVMSGKQGMGWKTMLVIGLFFGGIGRIAGSLFNEVTAENEVGDWDDDSEPDG